jgi:hypothetical protein
VTRCKLTIWLGAAQPGVAVAARDISVRREAAGGEATTDSAHHLSALARAWCTHPNPRDRRINELGLHCTKDNALRNDVVIAIAARSLAANPAM